MDTALLNHLRNSANGLTYEELQAAVAPVTALARRTMFRAYRNLLKSGAINTLPCGYGDHEARIVVVHWHEPAKACCA